MDDSEFETAREAALSFLSRTLHSAQEVVRYLERKGFSTDAASAVAERLLSSGIINEEAYGRAILQRRIRGFPRGYHALRRELAERGISRSVIETVIEQAQREFPEEELARRALAKKTTRGRSRDVLAGYLSRRGFSAHAIAAVLGESDET